MLGPLPEVLAAVFAASTLAGIAVVILFALWVFCLFDMLLRPGRGAAAKAFWVLALILLAPFAIVAYLVVRTRG